MSPRAEMALGLPFPWLAGKALVAPDIWARFGDVATYVEPFARSLAVLLARPHPPRTEVLNDRDAHVVNLWRSLRADAHGVAFYANLPVHEVDLPTRLHRLRTTGAARLPQVAADPDFHDTQAAGWWLSGRCRPVSMLTLWRASTRLRQVRITCAEWTRIVHEAVTASGGLTGLYLDPPYGHADVRAWAIANGERPTLRIALCGIVGEPPMPRGWTCVEWDRSDGSGQSGRVWFSPTCLPTSRVQTDLFDRAPKAA